MPDLIAPNASVAASFRSAMDDFVAEGRGAADDDSALGRDIHDYRDRWHTAYGFAALLEHLRAAGDPSCPVPPNWTHTTTFWWVEGDEFLGSIRVRHEMVPAVAEVAGLIGYDVAPQARRQGHGTAMLRATLPFAARLGFEQALIMCLVDNVASRRVIENNGGILDGERNGMLRFWVPTG